jgi:hypothetical protein
MEETIDKVHKAVKVLHNFRQEYANHKEKLPEYFKEGEPRLWEFTSDLAFARYDQFVHRVEMVQVKFCLFLVSVWGSVSVQMCCYAFLPANIQ